MSDNAPVPSASAPSISAAPTRNVVYGTIVGIISGFITAYAKRYLGDWLTPELVAGIPVFVGFLVAYVIPLTQQDVANRLSNPIVKLATQDYDNKTTAKVVSEAQADAETQKDLDAGIVPDALAAKMEPATTKRS